MAEDTRESDSSVTGTPVSNKKLPRGVVLGKDGKPCRTCNSLTDFMGAKKSIKPIAAVPSDCPPDVELLGRSSWTLLHSIAATYPEHPSPVEQSQVSQFIGLFSKLYPCWSCAADFQDFIAKSNVRTESREEFGQWMCEAHNDVNRKLGKKEFDCSKWQERWLTGWKNGSCG